MAEVLRLRADEVAAGAERAVDALEGGGLVLLPDLPFPLSSAEVAFCDASVLARGAKNVSLDPAGRLGGAALEGEPRAALQAMLARYADFADALLARLAPGYAEGLQRRRTSFRPAPVDTRALSPRKDDRRLHFDAFPSSPVGGRRILRVFSNVDPGGQARRWRLGSQPLEAHARKRLTRYPAVRWRAGTMERLGVTRGRRTDYDQAMLRLHDSAKMDAAWQAGAEALDLDLPAGASWVVYTDGVLHAAMAGRNALEQTYLLPVDAMRRPERSPLRTLERLAGRALA